MATETKTPAAELTTTAQPTGTAKVKAKVLIPFRDKYTKEICKKGAVLELTPERLAELTKPKKYVREVKS